MSVSGVFAKGKPTGHPKATAILKYIPRPRVPWQPSRFGRANLEEADLSRLWGRGRYRDGPGNFNSGYSTETVHKMEDASVSIIPKHELEKYMPDIAIPNGKALVTPVSLMSARAGHRVTHDMLHSYDPHIGRLQRPAVVDHDNISVEDPNRVGLNAATLDCRGRIYRWLRRGPFFQEDHYFRRSVELQRNGSAPAVSAHESSLMRKIMRLAVRGRLKEACEEYRRVTSVPPVEVYRALTAACVPDAKLADAIAIFEDGNAKLFYVSRDGEVLYNLMHCAVRARHRVRVVWVFNVMCGRFYENVLARAEVEPQWRFRISLLALQYLLDTNAGEEARAVYRHMERERLLDADLHVRLGRVMAEALKEGKVLPAMPLSQTPPLSFAVPPVVREGSEGNGDDGAAAPFQLENPTLQAFESLALQQNARRVAPQVAAALDAHYHQQLQQALDEATTLGGLANQMWSQHAAVPPLQAFTSQRSDGGEEAVLTAEGALRWLELSYPDLAVLALLRHARFKHDHRTDLLQKQDNLEAYLSRVVQWFSLLSRRGEEREEVPLPYLHKTRPSMTNENVRVLHPLASASTTTAGHPRLVAGFFNNQHYTQSSYLMPCEEGFDFYYRPGMRAVTETFAHTGPADTLSSRFLAQRPVHTERPVCTHLLLDHHVARAAASRSPSALLQTNSSDNITSEEEGRNTPPPSLEVRQDHDDVITLDDAHNNNTTRLGGGAGDVPSGYHSSLWSVLRSSGYTAGAAATAGDVAGGSGDKKSREASPSLASDVGKKGSQKMDENMF